MTGPPPLNNPSPKRANTLPIDKLRKFGPVAPLAKHNQQLARTVALMEKSKRGARLLKSLEANDVQLGGLQPGQAFGYYLAADRALYSQTETLAQAVQVISHEGRHCEQTVAGWSTITEFHQKGTKLPHDMRSYLRLNRVLEADADTTSLAVMWEIAHAEPDFQHAWDKLREDVHFGPMVESFERAAKATGAGPLSERAVTAGMKAAFQTWPTVGQPLRSEGYDRYLMAWVESQAVNWDEPVQADRPFTIDEVGKITGLNEARAYWTRADSQQMAEAFEAFIDEFDERLAAMDKQLLPPPTPAPRSAASVISATPLPIPELAIWRAKAGEVPGPGPERLSV
ncbi:MAG: hypothetical protein KI792_11660 [Alphaproteobacteria bacterium]|nr:hypothetical protein [Alphaproteobacteria bacterium SS10]